MEEQLKQRLKELKAEFESGQKMLVDYEAKQAELQNTLIRISGAIQVLEEELGRNGRPAGKGNGSAAGRGKSTARQKQVSQL